MCELAIQVGTSKTHEVVERFLQNRTVVVTGGSRGVGRAIVLELARRGARVMFTYVRQREAAGDVVHEVKAGGGEIHAVQADVRDFKRAQQVIGETLEAFGRIDGLVNNAGIIRDKALMLMSPIDWQDVIDTNLTGAFNYCRAAIVAMLKQRSGRIVNMTSVSGLAGMARQVNYSASKAGMIGLTKALAKEVASYGITVNAVAPGYIDSDMTRGIEGKTLEAIQKEVPMGRFGHPEEIGGLVAVLLSDASSYMTGQVVVVDGGLRV